jgi:hypothetical protein
MAGEKNKAEGEPAEASERAMDGVAWCGGALGCVWLHACCHVESREGVSRVSSRDSVEQDGTGQDRAESRHGMFEKGGQVVARRGRSGPWLELWLYHAKAERIQRGWRRGGVEAWRRTRVRSTAKEHKGGRAWWWWLVVVSV